MKKIAAFLIMAVFLMAAGAFAQSAQEKRVEFSTSASFTTYKYEHSSESTTLLNVPLRLGFFVWKGLEFEPEVEFTIPDDTEDTGVIFRGNISYNFRASKKTFPFILAGGGVGNAVKMLTWAADTNETVTVLNFGAGIKQLVGESAAIRLEYRFSRYSWSSDWASSYRIDHEFLAGVSLFF
jgi:opacity protein-like surface antigen